MDGAPAGLPRRCRLHPRQIFAFATARRLGWDGPAEAAVEHALGYFLRHYRRPDELFRACVAADGAVLDDRALLYDQGFALLGLHAAHEAAPRDELVAAAVRLLDRIQGHFGHSSGGFREEGVAPFQSNSQMHLFEACNAWAAVADGGFAETADEIGRLCLDRLVDHAAGVIDEIYDADWRPAGERRIEPGHQFEWAWLLTQWSRSRGEPAVRSIAERLFRSGEAAATPALHAAPGAVGIDGQVIDPVARLWPQTERLRTAVLLFTDSETDRDFFEHAALDAARAVCTYLDTPLPGLWRDKLAPDGHFVDEPAPASSLYHLVGAIAALKQMVIDTAARA